MCCACRSTSVTARVKQHEVLTLVHQASELDPEDQAVVCFVEMDDTEAVYPRITRFFLYHSVDNGVPAIEAIAMSCSVLED